MITFIKDVDMEILNSENLYHECCIFLSKDFKNFDTEFTDKYKQCIGHYDSIENCIVLNLDIIGGD